MTESSNGRQPGTGGRGLGQASRSSARRATPGPHRTPPLYWPGRYASLPRRGRTRCTGRPGICRTGRPATYRTGRSSTCRTGCPAGPCRTSRLGAHRTRDGPAPPRPGPARAARDSREPADVAPAHWNRVVVVNGVPRWSSSSRAAARAGQAERGLRVLVAVSALEAEAEATGGEARESRRRPRARGDLPRTGWRAPRITRERWRPGTSRWPPVARRTRSGASPASRCSVRTAGRAVGSVRPRSEAAQAVPAGRAAPCQQAGLMTSRRGCRPQPVGGGNRAGPHRPLAVAPLGDVRARRPLWPGSEARYGPDLQEHQDRTPLFARLPASCNLFLVSE